MDFLNYWPHQNQVASLKDELNLEGIPFIFKRNLRECSSEVIILVGHGVDENIKITFKELSKFLPSELSSTKVLLLVLCNHESTLEPVAEKLLKCGLETVIIPSGFPDPELMFGENGFIVTFIKQYLRELKSAEEALSFAQKLDTKARGANQFKIIGNNKVYSKNSPKSLHIKQIENILFYSNLEITEEVLSLSAFYFECLIERSEANKVLPEFEFQKRLKLNDYYLPLRGSKASEARLIKLCDETFKYILDSNKTTNSPLINLVSAICFELADHCSLYEKCDEYISLLNVLETKNAAHNTPVFYSSVASLIKKRGNYFEALKLTVSGLKHELSHEQSIHSDSILCHLIDLSETLLSIGHFSSSEKALTLAQSIAVVHESRELDLNFQFNSVSLRHAMLCNFGNQLRGYARQLFLSIYHGSEHINRGIERVLTQYYADILESYLSESCRDSLFSTLEEALHYLAEKHKLRGTLEEEFALFYLVLRITEKMDWRTKLDSELHKAFERVLKRKNRQMFYSGFSEYVISAFCDERYYKTQPVFNHSIELSLLLTDNHTQFSHLSNKLVVSLEVEQILDEVQRLLELPSLASQFDYPTSTNWNHSEQLFPAVAVMLS